VHVVATAGHVDHGKSTLVLALTGTDPDRFREEKERGLTIDLGFAWTTLPSGEQIAFVDVPGHVRFIKNMLAGVGAVDACLFVVAATEGWKPQSEEHLRILELLGITHGVVAVTKVGLVDDDWRELVRLELEERLVGTFLAAADVVEVDAPTGLGLEDLRQALDRLVGVAGTAPDAGRPRLWVDRAFAARGSGTVVTGTLTGGTLRVGDDLVLLPGGHDVRVRGLQALQHQRDDVAPGSRAAVNLVGVAHDDVKRGDVLVRRGDWHATRVVDASLRALLSLDHEVSRRGAYAAYVGSGEHPVRVRILGGESVAPGEEGIVRVYLPVALPLRPGDRFVLREHGRGETVGGGEVLDVAPVLPASRAHPTRDPLRVVAERGWVDAADLERFTGERLAPTVGRWVVDVRALSAVRAAVRAAVDGAGPLGLDVAQLDERQRAVLAQFDDVVVANGRALPAAAAAASDPLAHHPFVADLEAAPFTPPDPTGVDRGELRELVRRGLVIEREGVWFAPSAIEAARRIVVDLLAGRPDGFTVSDFREAASTSRKYALPLLAHLDATGMTRRRGDLRIAGARLVAGES